MEHQPSPEFIDLILSLDRQALLGRLSAGLTHVMNNVLGGVIGQVDLLMITGGNSSLSKDLDQIISICEEGTNFGRWISKIITCLQENHNVEIDEAIDCSAHIISRIYRRTGLQVNPIHQGRAPMVARAELLIQATLHLLLVAFDGELKNRRSSPKFTFELGVSHDDDWIFLDFTNIEITNETAALPENWEGIDYHVWVIQQILAEGGARLNSNLDERTCSLAWPVH